MPRLVLINGAPGCGKSTLAHLLAQESRMALALDIDGLKHALGRWDVDPTASGLHARRLAIALAGEQLAAGFDVVIGQYLARTAFIEDLERLADRHEARFVEVVLDLEAADLAKRLAERARSPRRPEHAINDRLVGPGDAVELVRTVDRLRELRPGARIVDASGPPSATLDLLRRVLQGPVA